MSLSQMGTERHFLKQKTMTGPAPKTKSETKIESKTEPTTNKNSK